MANPTKKPVTIDDTNSKEIDERRIAEAERWKQTKKLHEIRSITANILDSVTKIHKTKLDKINLRLKTDYYSTDEALNKIADRIANVFIGVSEKEISREEHDNKSKKIIKKYPLAKDLVKEFAGIWTKDEKSSIEFAKELRVKASSRTK